MEKFELKKHYKSYLQRVGLDESKMPKVQNIELQRAFMAGCGQMLTTLREDLSALEEDEAIVALQSMHNQVYNFFLEESNQAN